MKKHIVFDLDDTLIDSYSFNQKMFVDTFLAHQKDLDQEFIKNVHKTSRGSSMLTQFQKVIKELGLDLDPRQLLLENEDIHLKNVAVVRVFSNVPSLIKKLKVKGKKLHIFSNRDYKSVEMIISKNKLVGYFEKIVSCTDKGHEKPDPYYLLEIIRAYNDPKESFLFVGDSQTDKDFSLNAGVDYQLVDNYNSPEKLIPLILSNIK